VNKKVDDISQAGYKKKKQDIDKKKVNQVKDIINHFEKTFSQMKIFSSDHENVESFIDLLYDRISQYLQKNWKLEIGVEEFSFTLDGFPFYTEKQLSKSLPFLFYKDGVKILFLYKGLSREELKDFLEIIKQASSLPPEESDIVILLWEKDLANIRYFAPDDYLETKIGIGMKIPEYQIDKDKLFSGKINLRPEDKSALKTKVASPLDTSKHIFRKEIDNEKPLLSKSEENLLESMLQEHRKVSEENQFKTLLLDILYLEKRIQQVSSLIEQLIQYVKQQINAGNFHITLSIYQELLELKTYLKETDSSKKNKIEKFFESPEIKVTVSQIKEIQQKEPIKEWDALLQYLSFMGSESIPVLSYLYDHTKSPEEKDKILVILNQTGKQNLSELTKIARDERPELTLKIISILRDSEETRAINHLATFLSFNNNRVLHAAIKAIGSFKDPNANKILFSLLSHQDPELRIMAAENIHISEKDPVFNKVLNSVKEKKFNKKTREQKQALLTSLARSHSQKARECLENIIKKAGFFSGKAKVVSALCAVEALEKAEESSGYEIIRKMTHSRNKKVRKKCRKIEKKLSSKIDKDSLHDKY